MLNAEDLFKVADGLFKPNRLPPQEAFAHLRAAVDVLGRPEIVDGVEVETEYLPIAERIACHAISAGWTPVACDATKGDFIAAREEVFGWLARECQPMAILLADGRYMEAVDCLRAAGGEYGYPMGGHDGEPIARAVGRWAWNRRIYASRRAPAA